MDNNNLSQEEIDIDQITNGHFNSYYFKDLPDIRKTESVNFAVLQKNRTHLQFVPDEAKTDQLVIFYLKESGFEWDKEKDLLGNIFKLVQGEHCYLVKYLPDRLKTKEICEKLTEYGMEYLDIIPPHVLTKDMCIKAVQQFVSPPKVGRLRSCLGGIPYPDVLAEFLKLHGKNVGALNVMRSINPLQINSEIAREAIKQDLRCFTLIPEGVPYELPEMTKEEKGAIASIAVNISNYLKLGEEQRTELVSFVAVKAYPDFLEDVPDKSKSRRVIYAALKDGDTLKYLKPEQISPGMLITALKNISEQGGDILGLLPDKLKTYHRCLHAMESSILAIDYVPDKYKTLEFWKLAVNSLSPSNDYGYGIVYYMNDSDIFHKILPDLCNQFDLYDIMGCVPKKIVNKEIAEWVLARDGHCFHFLPEELQTTELLKIAVQQVNLGVSLVENVNPQLITTELLKEVIKKHPNNFDRIAEDKRTPELYLLQHKLYSHYFKDCPIPDSIKNTSNLFTLHEKVYDVANIDLSIDKTKALFSGKRITLHSPQKGRRITINYTPNMRKLYIKTSINFNNKEKQKHLKL